MPASVRSKGRKAVTRQERIDRTERGQVETHINRAIEHATALMGRSEGAERDRYSAVVGNLQYALGRLNG